MAGELRTQVLEDLAITIQSDFGQVVTLSRKDGSDTTEFLANTNDVHNEFDPVTGEQISGRVSQAVFRLSEVFAAFGVLPEQGWVVVFVDLPGDIYRVKDVKPDRTQGILILSIGD